MLSLAEPIIDLDTLFTTLSLTRGHRYRWGRAETEELKRFWSRIPRAELAERISRILQRTTGDPNACRTISALAIRAEQLGLPAYNGEADEIHLKEAAGQAGVSFEHLWRETINGGLPSIRKGKKRYVTRQNLAIWILSHRARQEAQAEILEAIEGEDTITKKEAMALTGLSETQLTRYLQSGIIRAWKVPDLRRGDRGDWAVDRASVLVYMELKVRGELATLLDANPDYRTIRERITRQVRELRHAGKLGKRDPLKEPKSAYLPGCFTVAQVASHLGLSTQSLYEAISRGDLKACFVVQGGRKRYAITPEEARRYARWVRSREHAIREWNRQRQKITHEHGLLMTSDLARWYGYSPAAIHRWVRQGKGGHKLKGRNWGRYLVFERADVEAFEKATGLERIGNG